MAGCKILIIDDDEDDVQILSEAFLQCGVNEVHYVFTAMQAFSYLERIPDKSDLPKLIVTDLYLPGITGQEFLMDLKRMDRYKHILVIVLSSLKSSSEIKKAYDLGAAEYLEKPSTYQEYKEVAARMADRILKAH